MIVFCQTCKFSVEVESPSDANNARESHHEKCDEAPSLRDEKGIVIPLGAWKVSR